MAEHRIFSTPVASVYPLYIAKVERKGRSAVEVDAILCWLTGHDPATLARALADGVTFRDFFDRAPRLNPARERVKGVVCGVRVEALKPGTMREIRILDKMVDELARGKAMAKILRD